MQRCLKKISAWLLVVCVLLSQTSYVFAQDTYSEPTLSVSAVTAEAGGTVDITVTMHNNPGIVSMQLDVEYDASVLTLTKVTDGGLIGTAVHSNNLSLCPYRLTWANDLSLTNYTDNGVIVTLTFAVAENAPAGEYPVAVTYTKYNFEIFDKDANEIDFDLASGSVTVKVAQCTHADKSEVSAKAADCVNPGNHLYYVCSGCAAVLKADGVTETSVEAETIPALGHDLSDATCESPAACKREGCGYTQGSAKGHDWSEKLQDEAHLVHGSGVNCQSVKQYYYDCARCDAIGTEIWNSTDVGGHKLSDTWQSENGEHYHVCTVEGCGYVADKAACTGGTATCEEKAVCSVCGKPYGELAPHALEEVPSKSADCEHSGNHKYYVCGGCGGVYKADGVTETTVDAEIIPATGHSHTEKVTAPTCTEQGYTTHTCACGESYVDTYSAALGHDYGEWYQTKAPTLEAEGEERRDCSRCDDYQTRKLPMLVHSYTSVVTAPTCTEKGYTTHTCTNCGDVYVDSYVAALGHSFTNYTANGDATCTADGTKIAKCDRCDATDTVTDVGSKTGHSMGDWVETKAPTCTEKGTEKIDCANCNHYETRETAAKGHTVVIDKAVEATCTASGLTEGKHCSVCGEVLVSRKEVSAKGHSYTDAVTAPTCTEKGYTTHTCHCGDSYVDTYADALDHAWNEGVVTLEPTEETEGIRLFSCSRCDAEKSEPIHCLNPHIHNYGYSVVVTEATCFQDGYTTYTCNCGASYVDDYVRSHELNLFDDNFSDKFYEKLTKPTCTESGGIFYVCRECGESIQYADIPARGHDLGEWETVREPNYLGNGLKERHCSRCVVFESEEINNNPFTDVGEGSQFKTAILWAYYSGVTSGKTATTFEPDATVTRAQFVTFLWRAAGCPEPETVENPFTDVGEGAYYYKAVMWAVENKITIGTTATTFSPDKLCTRGHVAMFLYRYAGEPVISLHDDRFEDVTPNNRYYKAVMWAIQEEITVGKTATTFGLHQECTRAQVVMFLYRYLEEGKQT